MSDEAFPNSEQLFQQAFSSPDPTTPLLQLLNDHQTYSAVQELVIYYTEAVEQNPYRGPLLAAALASVRDSADAPIYGADSLSSLINRELADQHFKNDYGSNEVVAYGPKNTYLLDSFLSGLSLKYKLTSTSDQWAAIHDGLNAPHSSSKSEALVVGSCIQLLLKGSDIATDVAGSYQLSAGTVASKLRAQKTAVTVRNPHANQVLEVRKL